jgi:hypothetical protein
MLLAKKTLTSALGPLVPLRLLVVVASTTSLREASNISFSKTGLPLINNANYLPNNSINFSLTQTMGTEGIRSNLFHLCLDGH